jgi:hypothetical protein
VLSFFSERLPPILYSEIKRVVKPIIEMLSVYFPPASIIRFAYSEYLRNRLNIRNIPGAATRGVAFRNLRIKLSP